MDRLDVVVLGSAAGGGFPQWNCRCPRCRLAWDDAPAVEHRTQAGIAATADGERYLLVGASPDLRAQILAAPALHPRVALRGSPIDAVLLLNADVDHIAGLLCLREGTPFTIYATRAVLDALDANPIFDVLARDVVTRQAVPLGESFLTEAGLRVTLFAIPGKPALWQEDAAMVIGGETETTVGATIEAAGRRMHHVPSCAQVTDRLKARLHGADLLLFDGTTWTDDEMMALGLSHKTAARMGHCAMSGPAGSIAALADTPIGRRVFIHVNNSNPALVAGSSERVELERAGWDIARDGMTIELGRAARDPLASVA